MVIQIMRRCIVTDGDNHKIKEDVRQELLKHGIAHVTIETEDLDEMCTDKACEPVTAVSHTHSYGHGHNHGHNHSHHH